MLDTDIMVAKIGWSFNNWRGFDQEMFKNRLLYDFEYIRNTGFGHELWNFYEGFSKNNYFGHIEGNPANFTSGIVLLSQNSLILGTQGPGEFIVLSWIVWKRNIRTQWLQNRYEDR